MTDAPDPRRADLTPHPEVRPSGRAKFGSLGKFVSFPSREAAEAYVSTAGVRGAPITVTPSGSASVRFEPETFEAELFDMLDAEGPAPA